MIKKLPGWKRGMIVGINISELNVEWEENVGFFADIRPLFPTNKFMGWVLGVAPTDKAMGCLRVT
jgi:hypothetical protein